MRDAKFVQKVDCDRCGAKCRWHPSRAARKDAFYLCIAGTTCVSWSTMGAGSGWCHDSTVPFCVWLEDMRRAQPTFIIHECVKGFDASQIEETLSDAYVFQQVILAPTELGSPCRRERSYIVCVHKAEVGLGPEHELLYSLESQNDGRK